MPPAKPHRANAIKSHPVPLPLHSVVLGPILGLLVLAAGFIFSAIYIDRPAKRLQEAVFNEQQLLETRLVAASLSRHINALRDDAAHLAAVLLPHELKAYPYGNASEFALRPAFSTYLAGLVFLPSGEESAPSMVPWGDGSPAHGQALAWALEHAPSFPAENRDGPAAGISPAAALEPKSPRFEIEIQADEKNQWLGYAFPVYRDGSLQGVLSAVFDMGTLSREYIQPMRSGRYGAGGLMDDRGTVLYDHEPEAMGINVFSGSHEAYPDLLRFLRSMTETAQGTGSYTFPRQRGQKPARKLGAWCRVDLGPRFMVILLSAPDGELEPGLAMLRTQRTIMTAAMIAVITSMTAILFSMRQKQLVQVARRLENEVTQSSSKLQEASATMYALMEASPIPVAWASFSSKRIEYMNAAFTGALGYTASDIPTLDEWYKRAYPDPAYREETVGGWVAQINLAKTTGEHIKPSMVKVADARGEEHIMYAFTTIAGDKAMTFFADQTERIRDQERIATSLAEKDTLLRELYHRTKNNLTVIHSLLSIYARQSESAEVQNIFSEMSTRIHSMALAHEMLYKSDNLSSINFDVYVRELLDLIAGSYSANKLTIEFELNLEPVRLSLDRCVPLGIILNELLTNAYKHAFLTDPSGKGKLSISLAILDNERLRMIVKDSGSKAPLDFNDKKHANMGILTVTALVKDQLGGAIAFDATDGFSCEINIPYARA